MPRVYDVSGEELGKRYLRMREGTWYVTHSQLEWDRPVRVRWWWETTRQDFAFEENGREVVQLTGETGIYAFRCGRFGRLIPVPLKRLGATEATWLEEEPVPPPATRLPTRWMRGRWERETAREGWVPFPSPVALGRAKTGS